MAPLTSLMAKGMSISRHLDLALLRAFVTVAQTGSISAAARQLHLTQGAISQRIQRLESFFECTLLERDSRGAPLSERGIALLAQAHLLLELNDRLCANMLDAPPPKVRVGVPYDMAGAHFAPMLKAYAQRQPKVEVSIVTGSSLDLLQAFGKGLVDLTISQCPATEAASDRLAVDALVWIGAPSERISLSPLPLCFVTTTCTFRSTAFALLSDANIPWRTVFENASVDATLATVRSGLAVTPWLQSLVPDDLQRLGRESGLPALPDFAIQLHVSTAASPATLAMAEVIREHYRQ